MSSELNNSDKLQAENEFLKMKLMLERGASFVESPGSSLPPEVENNFLNHIIEFEKQFENPAYVKVFDKIERPAHFKPATEIPDENISKAWHELSEYMNKHGIGLDVCSPNISERELYRFATEELFQHEIEDINIPGMSTNFIYDEFHPDPVYDNSRMVEQDLFGDIFSKPDLFFEIHYHKDGFSFNGRLDENWQLFSKRINRFKASFDEIEIADYSTWSCEIRETECFVKGNYKAIAKMDNDIIQFKGNFEVKLVLGELGYWDFKEIQIGGFDTNSSSNSSSR